MELLGDHRLRACVTTIVALTMGSAAYAQPISAGQLERGEESQPEVGVADDPHGSFEIVITAQGREQSLQDVPISATVINGQMLARFNIANLEAVAHRQPSFRISQTPTSDLISIRGLGSSSNAGFEQSVGTFVDGLYRGRSRSTRAALFDLERVEVLRGPQTTFFGNNTIAGAINITTRRPSNRLSVNASGFYAPNFDEYALELGITVPITDNLFARVAANAFGQHGYVRNVNLNKDGPRLSDQVGRAALRWEPSSVIEMDARVDVIRQRDSLSNNVQLIDCPPDPALGPPAGACARYLALNGGAVDDKLDKVSAANYSFSNYDMVEGLWSTQLRLGRQSLRLTTGYFWHNSDTLNDTNPIPGNQGGSVVGTNSSAPAKFDEHFRQFSQEIRLQSPDEGLISYIVGGYYARSRLDIDTFFGRYFSPFGASSGGEYNSATPIVINTTNSEITHVTSLFGSATVRPTTGIRVNAGLRYSSVRKHAGRTAVVGTSSTEHADASTFIPGQPTTQTALIRVLGVSAGEFDDPRRRDSRLLPSISFQADLSSESMAYVSYSKGFKAGGYSVSLNKSAFGPEGVDAYEVGIKSSLFDRALTLDISGFYSKYRDLQESVTILLPGGGTTQVVANAARSIAKGLEASARLRPFTGFTISADVSYLLSRYQDYPGAACTQAQTAATPPPCTQDLSGRPRAFAPKYSGNVGLSYIHEIGPDLQISGDVNTYFTSSFYLQPIADPYLSQAGHAKIDARVSIGRPDGRWELSIIGKNLTNKITASYMNFATGSARSVQGLAEPPRSIGVRLGYKY